MKEFIEAYERKPHEGITEELIKFLYESIDKSEEIKKIYKEVLIKQKHYNQNYYSNICILINALKFKKSQHKKLEIPYDMYYLDLPLRGELKVDLYGEESLIKTVQKRISYKKVKATYEAMGEEKTKNLKMKLIKQANEILNEDKLELDKGIKWKEKYERYIIKTYGRWSKEYEDYMTTLFDVGFLPIGPNLLLSINREHMRKAIEEKVERMKNKL